MVASDGSAIIHSSRASPKCIEANPLNAVLPGTYPGFFAIHLYESSSSVYSPCFSPISSNRPLSALYSDAFFSNGPSHGYKWRPISFSPFHSTFLAGSFILQAHPFLPILLQLCLHPFVRLSSVRPLLQNRYVDSPHSRHRRCVSSLTIAIYLWP
jgi:hypothetical protein